MNSVGEIQKGFLVNYFADFIVSKIETNHNSKIEVVDCENFIVVKGKTTSDKILNLNEVKSEFIEHYKNQFETISVGNTIDLIEYSSELENQKVLNLKFFNTHDLLPTNCFFQNHNSINCSEFPYGFSSNMGKKMYLYGKHLVYNFQSKIVWDKVFMKIFEKENEENFEIYIDDCESQNMKVRSAILDCFDFNFGWIEKNLTSENFEETFLKKLEKDFIVF